MGLSCSCDDFDKGDHDWWWEAPYRSVPPPSTTCCECGAALPSGIEAECFDTMEVYEPATPRPPSAENVLDDEPEEVNLSRHWGQRYDQLEADQEAWDDANGWDHYYERCERVCETQYRCERCEDLAAAFVGEEGLGFCTIAPGDLISSHREYSLEYGDGSIVWKRFPGGVMHPCRMLPEERLVEWLGVKRRRIAYWLRWGWKSDLRCKVWLPLQRRVMRALGYRYTYLGTPGQWGWTRKDPA